jgi:phosphotransferase system IIB component|tara:strand:+ start:263 stop:559 length:297 start_codon:yes stop_codon:yes gene_type:complete
MSLAKEVNEHLDNILAIRAEIRRMEVEIKDNQTLTNKQTGEQMEKKEVIQFVENTINDIKKDLNKITNNGENVKEIFTNKYYVNDFGQDKEIARNNLD